MNVVLIGSGNAATVLGRLIKSSGHVIAEVASPNAAAAQTLAKELHANAQNKYWCSNKKRRHIYYKCC
jgi:predicted dehydrogenase